MNGFMPLLRKQIGDSRWMLGVSCAALFGLGWLSVYVTSRIEERMRQFVGEGDPTGRARMMRAFGGGGEELTSATFEMQFWLHPFLLMPLIIWAIARGSAAVAGELERGGLDMVLSRPITRTTYYLAQVAAAALGLALLVGSLVAGNLIGTRFNTIEQPPSLSVLLRPSANLILLNLAIYGITMALGSFDAARWRSILVATVYTIAAFAAGIIARIPVLEDSSWKPWLERGSIFQAYDPVGAVGKAADLAMHLEILAAVWAVGLVLGFVIFLRRDLPASGG